MKLIIRKNQVKAPDLLPSLPVQRAAMAAAWKMNKKIGSFLRYRLPVYIYAGVIMFYAYTPKPIPPQLNFPNVDKLTHIIEYLVLAYLVLRMIRSVGNKFSNKMNVFFAVYSATLYGGLMEIYQLFIPFRSCDIYDLTADFAGAIIGALIYYQIFMRKKTV